MGNVMLDLDFLAASDYNRIKCFEEQKTISQSHLRELGDIYVRTKMHHDYGAGILHRHFPIREGCVLVHTLHDTDTDVCKVEDVKDLARQNIMPHSFFLNSNGQFQGYEYYSGVRRPLPNAEFLYQLRSFLINNQLAGRFAILAEDSRRDSVEFLLPENQGMVCIPREEEDDGQSVITGWKFSEEPDGKIRCVERRGCDPQGDGQHNSPPKDRAVGALVTETSRK